MTPQQNLSMTRGDSAAWSFWAVAPSTPSGVNFLGHGGITFTAKRSLADADASAIISKALPSGATSGSGFVLTNLTVGQGMLTLSPSDTASLTDAVEQLSYDLQFIDAAGLKTTIAAGKLTVRPDVTRA